MTDERAMELLRLVENQGGNLAGPVYGKNPLTLESRFTSLLATVWEEALTDAAKAVEAELAKLNGRWSLDSAYLRQAISAIERLKRTP